MSAPTENAFGSLIRTDPAKGHFKVARRSFVDPAIRQLEFERIFARCWLFVAHESEIPAANDFVTRTVASRPILFTRDRDGQVRAFFNVCPHRGATVCRQNRGNAKSYQCIYHGWVFSNSGQLLSQPGHDCYAKNFNEDGSANLKPVPRLEEYRGFWFLNFDRNAIPLHEYLGGTKEYIDKVVDSSEKGLRVIGGTQEYSIRGNWKLMAENSLDIYHGQNLHTTYIDYLKSTTGSVAPMEGLGGVARDLGRGHGVVEYRGPWGRPVARWIPMWGEKGKQEIDEINRRLEARLGPDRAKRIALNSFNLLIFPNFVINDIMSVTLRCFQPAATDYMTLTASVIGPSEESGSFLERRLSNFLEFLGPAGFATPDDIEVLETCQRSYAAYSDVEWNDVSKGMPLPEQGWEDEGQVRGFWTEWNRRLTQDA
jgi:p-cumate 2,3-dioxygenase alpha subunit